MTTTTMTRREAHKLAASAPAVGVRVAPVMSDFLAPPPFNDRFQTRYGSALSPQTLTAAMQSADTGYLYALADILDELRETDPHLHAELFKREAQVAGAPWELRPPEDSGAEGEAIAKWLTREMRDIESRSDTSLSFGDALMHLMSATYYGRAAAEVVWSYDGRRVEAIEYVHPRRLSYAVDWRLHLWDAVGGGSPAMNGTPTAAEQAFATFPGVPFDAFPAGKFIVHRPRIRGGYPQREGLGRTVAWYSIFKKFDVRDLLAFAEWAGRGLRIGSYSSGNDPSSPARASDEDVSVLEAAMAAMSSTVSVAIPDTTKLDVKSAPANNDVHEVLFRLCNAEMSKAILGATLTSDGGTTGGNRALGEVHERVGLMIARRDAESIGATLRRDLLRPMVERAFGPGKPVPSIVFAVDPEADLDALAKRIALAVESGIEIGQRDARSLLHLPDPQPDDVLVKPAKAAPAAPTP